MGAARVLDVDALLTVAHTVDGEPVLAAADPVGLRLATQPRRTRRAVTRCGLEVGPTWVDAERYSVPDCGDCRPTLAADEPGLF